jgi:prolyl 4-hydroxylase
MGSTQQLASDLSPDIVRAEECDAAGRHDDAINHLVAGVRKNDVEALTRLGKRLLVGDRAPLLANDGASFLADASKQGGAEAAAILAVLYGLGTSSRHDVSHGLASLVLAAERGWAPARAQLAVLAGREPGTSPDHSVWGALARGIDLAAWRKPPPSHDLNASPLIRYFPALVTPAVCDWLIEQSRPRLERALVYDALHGETKAHETRTNTHAVFTMLTTDFVATLVQTLMASCLGMPIRVFEPMTVLHYAPDEQITEHYDFVDPNVPAYEQQIAEKGQRVVTFLIYLNDDYADGETQFPRVGVTHKGRRGEGLFFVNALPDGAADTRTLHAGRPPGRGEKWIVSQFVRSRPHF